MAPLLTYSQQQAIKKISANNQSKYDPLALEVEENELLSLLGVELLQDIQANPTATDNALLLNGDTYEISTGHSVTFKGLRYMLAYFNYAKYVGESFVADTFSGMVKKTREDAELLSEGAIKRLQADARQLAMNDWERIRAYLDLNYVTFPLWRASTTRKPFIPRIYGVRKTIN